MTVVMKIDLVGPARRGLALGLNESAGYLGVAATAFATGALAAWSRHGAWSGSGPPRSPSSGLFVSLVFVRDTGAHVALEQADHGRTEQGRLRDAFVRGTVRDPVLRACSQAGLVNNLNDALAWGLAPLYLAAHGASLTEIGAVAAVYPAVWGAGQLGTGWLSDHTGRKPLIVTGMLVQAAALALLVAGGGAFEPALAAAALLGAGTALVYPTLIAAVSDVAQPVERAQLVGVYRFWRDSGFVAGALLAGFLADAFGAAWAIGVVAGLTLASGLWVLVTRFAPPPRLTVQDLLVDARARIAPRLAPGEAYDTARAGALLVDVRSVDERLRDGVVPGSLHVPLSVLAWRADPDCDWRNPILADLDREIVVFCAHGYSSSLAAATLRELGFRRATDITGGYLAWKAAALPVQDAALASEGLLPGMGAPEPDPTYPTKEERWPSTPLSTSSS